MAPAGEVREIYDQLAARVAAGKLFQPVDSTFSLGNFKAAISRLGAPDRSGKVLFASSC
ncbi:MAG: hypothetical protein HC845_01345 [Akkermansiaceae bacterium]|nr:hypothetical protein [Akkermansiaceae bacterium]